jgi:hypothetical protein
MSLQRIMFLNYDDAAITIAITAHENVGVFELCTSGEDVEVLITTHYLPGQETEDTWNLVVPAGKVWGFGVYEQTDFTDPEREDLTIAYSNGKNPWPTPPPPPPPAYSSTDFGSRYSHFLDALGAKSDERPKGRRISVNVPPSGRP